LADPGLPVYPDSTVVAPTKKSSSPLARTLHVVATLSS
jgi:hypothetical protein